MRVSLTGKAAWQMGSTGLGRTDWETVECGCGLCQSGRFVAVDEMLQLYEDEPARPRHLARAAVHERAADMTILTNGEAAFPPPCAYNPVERKRRGR